jgi:hypothetical protein
MEREIVIKLHLRRPRTRTIAAGILIGLAAVAYAAVPHKFASGETLSSANLNDDFAAVEHAYCGATAPMMPRLAPSNGYAASVTLCSAVAGCSSTAHVCSQSDISRYAATGGTAPDGWIATGMQTYIYNGSSNINVDDCVGFTSNTGIGTEWTNARATTYFCSSTTTLPLLCCN